MLLVLCCTSVHGQTAVGYSYDAVGNRYLKQIVMNRSQVGQRKVVEEKLGNQTIRIHPNPTDGVLMIELSSLGNTESGHAEVFSSTCVQVVTVAVNHIQTAVDISTVPNGVYFLRLTLGEESSTWKIVKK